MIYLNKNIEEIGKKTSEKSLINNSTTCGVFQELDYNSSPVKSYLQSCKML